MIMRSLMQFYGVRIPKPIQANLVLSVEKHELGISAGLQDRVAQVYEGLIHMDFNRELLARQGYGRYGIMAGSAISKNLYLITDFVEKPDKFE